MWLLLCPSKDVGAVLGCAALVSTFPFHKHFSTALTDLKLSKEKVGGQTDDRQTQKLSKFKDTFLFEHVAFFSLIISMPGALVESQHVVDVDLFDFFGGF